MIYIYCAETKQKRKSTQAIGTFYMESELILMVENEMWWW